MTDPLPIIATTDDEESLASDIRQLRAGLQRRSEFLESEIATALGAQIESRNSRSAQFRADVVVDRGHQLPPLAVEIKLWQYRLLAKNLSNRIIELLGQSVEMRRELPYGAQLALAIVIVGDRGTDWNEQRLDRDSVLNRATVRLASLLSERRDDAGYDRIIVGLSAVRGSQWWALEARFGGPTLLPDFAAAISHLERPPAEEVQRSDANKSREGLPPRILLVADEWNSRKGGISTFNRELAVAFADVGCEVHVAVPEADSTERDAALEKRVTLVVPPSIPGVKGNEILLTRPRFEDDEYEPDIVVGHGRILGPYAYALQNNFFRVARRVHFVHTDAEMLESAKEQAGGPSRMLTVEDRQRTEVELAVSASLVAGVGPLLAESITHAMRGWPAPRPEVVNFLPGLRDWGDVVDPTDVPPRRQVLLIARAEDIESKGIDIAVEAMLDAINRFPANAVDSPLLIVRGVPDAKADAVKRRLDAIASPHVQILLRPYRSDENTIKLDLWQSRVVIMPSRHEGFGLAAYEAIAAGVPVLISQDSGLARLLIEKVPDGERVIPREILPVRGDTAVNAEIWGQALYETLSDPSSAFLRAAHVRNEVLANITWNDSVQKLLCGVGYHTLHDCASL
ncbi:glycosyltransferase family 4 protein [Paractinoplanes atraurantiacus]|uniref:Glycosyltransferase involved in cell wall bisynthesis n=1 Tax=Paractinoplanes atraurantiacus TaxID=1036182 RepID=A0A285JD72_9ACTN|nr:glycosyltransferase family 4 protein [Actinoplanes atraurantiacus]SNY58229.1 Glycosyltransferase involved in cell wall bisynthesis [Actinoplanes atraurantiacus]